MDEFNARGASTHGYTNPSQKVDTAYVESQSEETDKHGSVSYTHLTLPTIYSV